VVSGHVDARSAVVVNPGGPLRGDVAPPPDKSITHRAWLLSALNHSATSIINPSTAEDPERTRALVELLGCRSTPVQGGWQVARYTENAHGNAPLAIDCGNSGSTARMACGLLAGERGEFILTGDASLSRRPMSRVVEPLQLLGASIESVGGRLPISISGGKQLRAPSAPVEVASAQVYTALALAGMRTAGAVAIRRTAPMRDHTARMLRAAGITVEGDGDVDIIRGAGIDRELVIAVPGDPSAAAILAAAATVVPGSSITIHGVSLNPTRLGFFRVLERMGGTVAIEVEDDGEEPSGSIHIGAASLHGTLLHAVRDPDVTLMVDELPLLALLGAVAQGETEVRGAPELRVKESDRIAVTCALLRTFGVEIEELEDGFRVRGPQQLRDGGAVDHAGDHRLCMMAGVAALCAERPTHIPDSGAVAVSHPQFWEDLRALGGAIEDVPSVAP